MAFSHNFVSVTGRLGKDPEFRNLSNGSSVMNLSIATEESWNDRASGERKSRTDWHRVVMFITEAQAGHFGRTLKKGSMTQAVGSLTNRKWTDQQGAERTTTEIKVDALKGGTIICFDPKPGGAIEDDQSHGAERYERGVQARPAARQETERYPDNGPRWSAPPARNGTMPWDPPSTAPKGKTYAGPGSDLDDPIPY